MAYNQDYKILEEKYSAYKCVMEEKFKILTEENERLGKKLDVLSNLVEISKYINSNISDENLISIINDMIIGILGAIYSSIYIKENNNFIPKATNKPDGDKNNFSLEVINYINNAEAFVINCSGSQCVNNNGINIRSTVGVPICIRDKFVGYIVVEHSLCDFFNTDHIKFITSIANQIGVSIENNNLYNKVKESSIKDPLLGIYNRKYFFDVIEDKIGENNNIKFGIVMLDIDDFKKVNDLYGHQFGDKVLINTTGIITDSVSKEDIVSRYGGEEIIIYLSDVEDEAKVFHNINNMRDRLSKSRVELDEAVTSVTASFGLSFYPGSADTLSKVINVADSLLYEAKRTGKNKVVSG